MKAELVPKNGDPPIPITRDVTIVGRKATCDIQISHPGLSKLHCVLVRTDGLLIVRDLASTNGTKLNGQRVRWAAMCPNDRLSLGGYKMQLYLGPDHLPAPSERGAAPPHPTPPSQPVPRVLETDDGEVPNDSSQDSDSGDYMLPLNSEDVE